MSEINFIATPHQNKTLGYLRDDVTTEVLFGGGAGGGKSYLGCAWLIMNCLAYPESRWLMGRATLKNLKETTLNSFFDVCKEWDLKKDKHWKLNTVDGVIRFINGSEILLKDLADYPADPKFDSLGSLEITGAFIDECNQISQKAKDIVMSRIRYKLDDYGIMPKLLMTCNPARNWVYSQFYKPNQKGTLSDYRKFVPALAKDNRFISKFYTDNLKKMEEVNSVQRLLYGNWEYDDDPEILFNRDDLENMFGIRIENTQSKWLTVDVARLGADRTVYGYWEGYQLQEIVVKPKTYLNEVVTDIFNFEKKYDIPRKHIIIDIDGMGAGVVDNIRGCRGFMNGGKPINPRDAGKDEGRKANFENRKTQAYYEFAWMVDRGKVGISPTPYKDDIIQELSQVRQRDTDKDGKLKITRKEDIIAAMGKSPDLADMLMMRFDQIVEREHTSRTSIIGNIPVKSAYN